MTPAEYWQEAAETALDEMGLFNLVESLTAEQRAEFGRALSVSHEHYGTAFYTPPPSDQTTTTKTDPVDELAQTVTAAGAFEMGYAWALGLRGQTLEDSRAVGRTLGSDLFESISCAIDREIKAQGFDSFRGADHGISQAKRIIKAALDNPIPTPLEEAAPALLEALQLFMHDWRGDQSPPRKVRIAQAAIKLATGETS